MIFGLAGTNGAGKDTVAELLEEKFGYLNISATKMLGDELTRRGMSHERKNKSGLSAEWRRQYGMSAIVDRAYEQYVSEKDKYKGMVVGSLRHPGETDKIHELGGLQIWVDADPEIRYARISKNDRGRGEEDNLPYEDWLADEAREMHPEGDGATLHGAAVKEKADIVIINNYETVEAFKEAAITQLKEYLNN